MYAFMGLLPGRPDDCGGLRPHGGGFLSRHPLAGGAAEPEIEASPRLRGVSPAGRGLFFAWKVFLGEIPCQTGEMLS